MRNTRENYCLSGMDVVPLLSAYNLFTYVKERITIMKRSFHIGEKIISPL